MLILNSEYIAAGNHEWNCNRICHSGVGVSMPCFHSLSTLVLLPKLPKFKSIVFNFHRLSRHDTFLIREFKRYSVHELNRGQLSQFQPLLAWIGLIGCLATVFVFSTASWWRFGEPSASNVLATWTVVSNSGLPNGSKLI
jgi:hypothetical protein